MLVSEKKDGVVRTFDSGQGASGLSLVRVKLTKQVICRNPRETRQHTGNDPHHNALPVGLANLVDR
jgi:hypothetical protein